MNIKRDFSPSVLVVNDTPDVLAVLTELLEHEGYRVTKTLNPHEALELARRIEPDVIISDVIMPGLDGLQLCRQFKQDPATANVPVMLASAIRIGSGNSLEGLEVGADDYIELPNRLKELPVKVARLAERHRVERHYREIVEQATDIIYTVDARNRIISINEAGARFFKRPLNQLIGVSLSELVETNRAEPYDFAAEHSNDNPLRLTYRDDKEVRYLEVASSVVRDAQGQATGARGIMRDVTRRMQSDTMLRESEERHRTLFERHPQPMWVYDSDTLRFLAVNEAALRHYGYSREEFVAMTIRDIRPPEDLPALAANLKTIAPHHNQAGAWRHIKKDGTVIDVEITSGYLIFKGRRARVVQADDITLRLRAEREKARLQVSIANSALEWRLTFDAIPYPVLIVGVEGEIKRFNKAAKELAGIAYDELINRNLDSIADSQPWRQTREVIGELRAKRETVFAQTTDEVSGRTWNIEANLIAKSEDGGEQVIITARDVTRDKELESELRRGEKMSLMGSLVAGVAHEVRNPLFGISATLDAFEARTGNTEESSRYLKVLRTELDRLSDLMRDLLELGKPVTSEFYPGAIEDLIAQAVRGVAPLAAKSEVRIVNRITRKFPVMPMDRRRVIQIFLNLLENAIYYSSPDGEVVIEAATNESDDQTWIEVFVKDSGPGIKIEDLPHIFDPFFTRRRKGSGLGLSIVQRIVEEHHGTITAGNRTEGGTVMCVRLPVPING